MNEHSLQIKFSQCDSQSCTHEVLPLKIISTILAAYIGGVTQRVMSSHEGEALLRALFDGDEDVFEKLQIHAQHAPESSTSKRTDPLPSLTSHGPEFTLLDLPQELLHEVRVLWLVLVCSWARWCVWSVC